MSTTKTEDGLVRIHKGRGDHRIVKGNVGARSEPRFEHGDVSLWRMDGGQRYSLFASWQDAYDLADALDALLEWHEKQEG